MVLYCVRARTRRTAGTRRNRFCCKATGRNEFTGTTDFQSVAWDYSTDWKSIVQIADGKFYPAGRLSKGD